MHGAGRAVSSTLGPRRSHAFHALRAGPCEATQASTLWADGVRKRHWVGNTLHTWPACASSAAYHGGTLDSRLAPHLLRRTRDPKRSRCSQGSIGGTACVWRTNKGQPHQGRIPKRSKASRRPKREAAVRNNRREHIARLRRRARLALSRHQSNALSGDTQIAADRIPKQGAKLAVGPAAPIETTLARRGIHQTQMVCKRVRWRCSPEE